LADLGAGAQEHAGETDAEDAVPVGLGELGERQDGLLDARVVEGGVRRPNCSTVRSTARWTSSSLVTSQVRASTFPPSAVMSRAVSSSASVDRSAMATCAPARAKAKAVARPMPDAAPVTKATLPVKS
jgi:hypothetical protein